MNIEEIVRDHIGTIFGRAGVARFSFSVKQDKSVQKGQFLLAIGDNRVILARVIDIETRMQETICHCEILGECIDTRLKQCRIPVRAGYEIYNPSGEFLSKLITRTTKEEGLYIGKILAHPDFVPVYYNPKDLRVHVFVSATTGGGKSYTLAVFIEELIKHMRKKKDLSIIIFDVHDEYSGLIAPNMHEKQVKALEEYGLKPTGFEDDILIFDWENNPPYLSPIFSPDRLMFVFSMKDIRYALQLKQLMGEKKQMHIDDIYRLVEISDLHPQTKQALLTRIGSLRASGFLSHRYIKAEDFCKPGKVTIFRLIGTPLGDLGIRFFVADITREVFEAKKIGKIKHNVILVVDEAHLFAPAKGRDDPVKEILVRVAREGRKMGVWLILATQSPRDLSDVIIINCSTIIALKMQKHDISKLSQIFGLPKKLVEVLTSVSPGESFIKAPSFSMPIMVRIRPRQSSELKAEYVDISKIMEKVVEISKKTRKLVSQKPTTVPKEIPSVPKPPPQQPPQPPTPQQQPITRTQIQQPQRPIPQREPVRTSSVVRVHNISRVVPQQERVRRSPPAERSNVVDLAVSILADQIKAHDYVALELIRMILEYDSVDIVDALQYVSEDIIDVLIAEDILRLEDSKLVLNLDKKIEEFTGRRITDTRLALAKKKLKMLLGL